MNIRKLLGLCEHQWKTIASKTITAEPVNEPNVKPYEVGQIYIQECAKCGTLKQFKVTVI